MIGSDGQAPDTAWSSELSRRLQESRLARRLLSRSRRGDAEGATDSEEIPRFIARFRANSSVGEPVALRMSKRIIEWLFFLTSFSDPTRC